MIETKAPGESCTGSRTKMEQPFPHIGRGSPHTRFWGPARGVLNLLAAFSTAIGMIG